MDVNRKRARFRPMLTHFEAIFSLHLVARRPTGQLWAQNGVPLRADHLSWTFSVGVQFSGGGLIQYLRGGASSELKGGSRRPQILVTIGQNSTSPKINQKCTPHSTRGSNFEFFNILDLPLGVSDPFLWDLGTLSRFAT